MPCAAISRPAWIPATPAPTTTTLLMVCVLRGKLDIGFCIHEDILLLDRISLLDHFPWNSDYNRTLWYIHALPDYCTGPNHGSFPYPGSVEHNRTHADEHLVGYGAAVQDRTVAYGDLSAQGYRKTPAGMHNAVVLDVRPVANDDPVFVGPHNSPEPDPHLLSYYDIADDCCIAGHEKCLT